MKDKTVAILESRVRDHIASLVRNYGGTPFSAPALAEIPDVDPAHQELIRDWNSTPPDIFIFQTGVGTRALFDKLFYGMLFKGPGIISVDLKPCLLAVPQFHSGNVRVKPIFVGFRHRDYSSFFRARRMCWRQNPAPVYGISVDRFPDHMPTYSVSEVLSASARTNAEKKGCREDHDPLGLDPVRTKLAFSVGHFLRPFIGFLNCKAYFGA
jgi:hypothetical protein